MSTVRFYDYLQPFYRFLWAKNSLAIHYGIWDDTTQTLEDALINTNRILANYGSICYSDTVLDVGCGIGGSAMWLAQHYGVKAVGITTSCSQSQFAAKQASSRTSQGRSSFLVQDFLSMGFKSSSFTVAWAVESSCHAQSKEGFAQEVFRVLKPGGRLLVADGFANDRTELQEADNIFTKMAQSYNPLFLVSARAFASILLDIGFSEITFKDYTSEVIRSARRIHTICTSLLPLAESLCELGVIDSLLVHAIKGGIAQRDLLTAGHCQYKIMRAEKPA